MKSNLSFIALFLLVSSIATITGYYLSTQLEKTDIKYEEMAGLLWPSPKTLGTFNAINHDNVVVNTELFNNQWSMIFFGYTHCPDICPITMNTLSSAYEQLQDDPPQIIFISVDSKRDTPAGLSQYLNYFNDQFIGLIDQPTQDNLSQQIGIVYYANPPSENKQYTVDHSASIFIIDPKSRVVGKLSPPHAPNQIVQDFKRIKAFISSKG